MAIHQSADGTLQSVHVANHCQPLGLQLDRRPPSLNDSLLCCLLAILSQKGCNLLRFQVRFEEATTDMGAEEGSSKSKAGAAAENAPPPPPSTSVDDKAVVPPSQQKTTAGHDSMSLALVDKVADSSAAEKSSGKSHDRDVALAQVENEKRSSLIKAWEESEKTKAENKAQKKLATIGSWENTKKAAMEAQLRKIEEKLEKKKADYGEKMKNKIAIYHKEAEEKRAMVAAQRNEDILKADELAGKYRATGQVPKKLLSCFAP